MPRPSSFFSRGPHLVMALIVLACADYLVFGEKPWRVAEAAQALQEAGKKPDLHHDVVRGLYYAAGFGLVASVLLFLTSGIWGRPLGRPDRRPAELPRHDNPGSFWILVLLAAALGLMLRWSLASGSLWWDEIWSVKHASHGYFRPNKDKGPEKSLVFRPTSWEQTIWLYRKPTNHPPSSVASRISQTLWRKFGGHEPHEFRSIIVRLPHLLAGVLSIIAVAVLVRRWGFTKAGTLAAFLLAIHPWHIRYAIDARAFSFVALLTMLGCLCLTALMQDQAARWRYWVFFGLIQFLLMWCLPNSLWFAGAFAIAAFVLIRMNWWNGANRATAAMRLLVVNTVAAIAFLFAFLPNLFQYLRWQLDDPHFINAELLMNALSQMCFGLEKSWAGGGPGADGLVSLSSRFAEAPLLGVLASVVLAGGFTIGFLRLLKRRPEACVMIGALLAGTIVYLIFTALAKHHFYHRYLIFLIGPLCACVAIGIAGVARAVSDWRPAAGVATAVGLLTVYFLFVRPQIVLLNSRSYAPFQETALFTGRLPEAERGAPILGYGLGGRMLPVYLPRAEFVRDSVELDERVARARHEGTELVVVLGYESFNRQDAPTRDGFHWWDVEDAFELLGAYSGIDPQFHFEVFRLRKP